MTYSISTVFCDDIRVENNGKLILIGVYQEDLIPAFLPQMLGLSLWSRLDGVAKGSYDITLRVGVNKTVQHELKVKLEIQADEKPAHIHVIGLPVQIDAPSSIFVEVTGLPNQNDLRSSLGVRDVQSPALKQP
jgi:hypothetical protein